MSGPYSDDIARCSRFIQHFSRQNDDGTDGHKYLDQLQAIANRTSRVLRVDLDDVVGFENNGDDWAEKIEGNARRFVSIFAQVADDILPAPAVTNVGDEDVLDVLMNQRLTMQLEASENQANGVSLEQSVRKSFPKELIRRYEIQFRPRHKAPPRALRNVMASDIGHLVVVRGIVTRVSDVKPLIRVATYTCDSCGFEIYQVVGGRTFMPLSACPSQQCTTNRSSGKLCMQTRGSKFVKFQELKLQEMPDQVPIGHIPRTMTIHVRGELTRACLPGDNLTIGGIFLPTPYTGFRAMRAGLIADTYLEAMSIQKHKKSYANTHLSATAEQEIDAAANDPRIYEKLSQSLAPEIYGHEDIKKALLLMLVGGVTRHLKDGMRIRGDINICLMGDPGVAKSQLLKFIAGAAPRGVYTTGKGSSGVGLTAAVIRDPVTQEFSLEGGALVLADMGICCIDEFDKMEESDRTAIHEVMEQQTVSIAKGGITTTLNARTAILAAANPLYGRYNRRLSPADNINLPAALLSRFDLIFLIIDKADLDLDLNLARHIAHVHQFECHPELDFEPVSMQFVRNYVTMARQVDPFVPPDLSHHIVETYVEMRMKDVSEASEEGAQSLMTARQLLSILRLAQALARLRFSQEVSLADVEESIRLVESSKASLLDDDGGANGGKRNGRDYVSSIYEMIKKRAVHAAGASVKISEIEPVVLRAGYSSEQLWDCIDAYEDLNVLQTNPARTTISLCDD